MEIFLVIFIVWIFYVLSKIRFRSSGNVFSDMIDERKRKEEKYQDQNRESYDWKNGSPQYQNVFNTKAETSKRALPVSSRRTEKERLQREKEEKIRQRNERLVEVTLRKEERKKKEREEEEREIRIRNEVRQEEIEAAKCKEEAKKNETPEERKARLKKLAKERVKSLINTPQSLGENQGDTSGDNIYIGPRGGRYRVTDKGRKSYDVK